MEKLIDQLKRHEGLRLRPYKCTAGKWSIGYGCNLTDAGIDHEGLVWNKSYAERVLRNHVGKCNVVFPDIKTYQSLNPCRQAVLTNMVFNIGSGGVLRFKRMLSALYRKDFEDASKEMLNSRWAKQVGSRATELAEQMRTGEWQF